MAPILKDDQPRLDKTDADSFRFGQHGTTIGSKGLMTTMPGCKGRDGLFKTKKGKDILLSDAECCLKAWAIDKDDMPHYDEVIEHHQDYYSESKDGGYGDYGDYGDYGSEVERLDEGSDKF